MADSSYELDLVLVADNDSRYRASVRGLLERAGIDVVEVDDGREALEAAARRPPNVVVLDVRLAGVSGYQVVQELRERYGDSVGVVFVTGERTDSIDRVSGLLLGADDYVVKPFDPDELLARIRTVLRRVGKTGPTPVRSDGPAVDPDLTPRELEVLRLLADGLTQAEIAERLVISPRTVGTHIQNLLGKLSVHSRAQAVAFAHRHGLVVREPVHQTAEPAR